MQVFSSDKEKTEFIEIWSQILKTSEIENLSKTVSFKIEDTRADVKKKTKATFIQLLNENPRFKNLNKTILSNCNVIDFYKRLSIININISISNSVDDDNNSVDININLDNEEFGHVKTGGFFQSSTLEQGDSLQHNQIYQLKYAVKFSDGDDPRGKEYVWCCCKRFQFTKLPSFHLKLKEVESNCYLLLDLVDIPRRVLYSYRFNNEYYINTHFDSDMRKHIKI
jgi:hypothetical protein